MTELVRFRRGARLPLVALIVASLMTASVAVALSPAGAQDLVGAPSTTTTAPSTTTTTTSTGPTPTPPPVDPIVAPHTIPPSDTPVDPEALPTEPLEPVDPDAPVPVLRDPTPHIRVLLADLAVIEAQRAVPAAQAAVDAATAEVATHQAELAAIEAQHQAAVDGLDGTRDAFIEMAVVSFMYANGGAAPQMVGAGVYEQRKNAQLTGAVLEHRTTLVSDANAQVAALAAAIPERQAAVVAAQQRVAEQQVELDRVDEAVRAAEAERYVAGTEDVEKFFDPDVDGGRAANPDPTRWQVTLAGQSTFTVEELTGWFLQWKVTPQASVGAAELAKLYVEEGNLENIRGDVMLAQSIWETGTFSNRDTKLLNNFAGIGHCDTCPEGFNFATARDGVRGQAQLLKSYVEVAPTYANPLVDSRLRGPAGCCQTWNQLTKVWATAPTYGPLILGLYEDMLEWLVVVRSAEPADPPAPAGSAVGPGQAPEDPA